MICNIHILRVLFYGIEHRVCGGSCAVNSVADKWSIMASINPIFRIISKLCWIWLRDDKSRYEQLLCQIHCREAVTCKICSALSGTLVPPDGMGESIATSKVGEEYIWKSIIERSNRNRFDFFVLLERFKEYLRKISIFPL